MEALNYLAEVYRKSGGVGWITMLLLFATFGVGLERLAFWGRLWGVRRMLGFGREAEVESAAVRMEGMLRAGRFAEAGEQGKQSRHPALRILGEALTRLRRRDAWPNVRDQVVAETVHGNVQFGRRFLIIAIQTFGLLGMLGTCKGLYSQLSSFNAGNADPSMLANAMCGMGEAFTTTLLGLGAAGIATLMYMPNEMAIERFEREMRGYNARIQAALREEGAVLTKPAPVKPAEQETVKEVTTYEPYTTG